MNSIFPAQRLLAVVGHPLSHTLSPKIHNQTIERLGLPYCYIPIDIRMADEYELKDFLNWAWQIGIHGINITLPYKEMFASVLRARLPSINTLVRGESFWESASTDGLGFLRAVERIASLPISHFRELLILGNGGAAIALADTWKKKYPESMITVARRSDLKDKQWQEILGPDNLKFILFEERAIFDYMSKNRYSRIVAQASSAPLHGDDLSAFIPAFMFLDGVFIDMTYGPKTSALVGALKAKGQIADDGLKMLVEQALASQQLWWGRCDSFENIYKDLKALL